MDADEAMLSEVPFAPASTQQVPPPDVIAEPEAEPEVSNASDVVEEDEIPAPTQDAVEPPLVEMPATDPEAPPVVDQTPPPLPRRGLDESLMAVLREEADRETAVRRAETPRPLESQPDLGLEETSGAASAAKAVRDRLSRLRTPEPEPDTPEKPTARRDLLPDIEEINSTLRASTEDRSSDSDAMPHSADKEHASSGFRSGFSLMLLLAVLLVVTYVAAPKIAEQLPATKPALQSYVAGVDAARLWLDGAMQSAISALQNLTGGAG